MDQAQDTATANLQAGDHLVTDEGAVDEAQQQDVSADDTQDVAQPEAKDSSRSKRMVPLPALDEARQKSRELSRQLDETRYRLELLEQSRNRAPVPEERDLTDDEIYADVPKALRAMNAKNESARKAELRDLRYGQSEVYAKKLYDDFDEVIEHYKDMARKNPHIARGVEDHAAPAIGAYEIAKQDLNKGAAMDPEKFEALIKKRVDEAIKQHKRGAVQGVSPGFSSGQSGSRSASTDTDEFADAFKKPW